jgi:4-diphosphocytidyl-2-C-methyl-D-erythritol kinase
LRYTKVSQPALSLPSFAKINWSLEILGRRPDGYHEIRTLLQTISLHDDLHFELTDDGAVTLSCDDPDLPTDDGNLVVRAANALKRRHPVAKGARIRLDKRIPAQAGLGGASSNAAISLLALSHLWRLEITAAELLEIAATLGADVPFFLLGGTARATGTGTTISSLPDDIDRINNSGEEAGAACRQLIVITPNASVSTVEAYRAFSDRALTTKNADTILSVSRSEADSRYSQLWALHDSLKNDFESVIFDSEPEIRRAKETLLQAGALGALLAGSGSSVFGIFADRKDQQRAVNELKPEAGWRIFPCVTVSQKEYLRAVCSWGS